jgi:4-carboxymuconolactone decarboxylase
MHWHGATRTSTMTHVAVGEIVDGKTVTWFEPVSEKDNHGLANEDE